jgi:8-oxo-dGTP diphosphatase
MDGRGGATPITVCLVVREGKVLLIRRKKPPFEGLLSLPGGKIGFGETVRESAERELLEETGMEARLSRHAFFVEEHLTEGGRITGHFLIHVCELQAEPGEGPGKGEYEPVWVGLDELGAMEKDITPSDIRMIRAAFEGKKGAFRSLIEKKGGLYVQKEFREI